MVVVVIVSVYMFESWFFSFSSSNIKDIIFEDPGNKGGYGYITIGGIRWRVRLDGIFLDDM